LTLDRVEVILIQYLVEVYPYNKLDRNRENFLWTYRRTDGHTWVPIY